MDRYFSFYGIGPLSNKIWSTGMLVSYFLQSILWHWEIQKISNPLLKSYLFIWLFLVGKKTVYSLFWEEWYKSPDLLSSILFVLHPYFGLKTACSWSISTWVQATLSSFYLFLVWWYERKLQQRGKGNEVYKKFIHKWKWNFNGISTTRMYFKTIGKIAELVE
jgi:hypothetical protein